jgi:hypothetical protein
MGILPMFRKAIGKMPMPLCSGCDSIHLFFAPLCCLNMADARG